jgi:hypothetical protein
MGGCTSSTGPRAATQAGGGTTWGRRPHNGSSPPSTPPRQARSEGSSRRATVQRVIVVGDNGVAKLTGAGGGRTTKPSNATTQGPVRGPSGDHSGSDAYDSDSAGSDVVLDGFARSRRLGEGGDSNPGVHTDREVVVDVDPTALVVKEGLGGTTSRRTSDAGPGRGRGASGSASRSSEVLEGPPSPEHHRRSRRQAVGGVVVRASELAGAGGKGAGRGQGACTFTS